jgi:hypothetical protein
MHILILQADCSIDAIGTHTCGALMSSAACAHPSVFVTVDSRHGQLTNNRPMTGVIVSCLHFNAARSKWCKLAA